MKDGSPACTVCKVVYALVIIGALNWGLVGIGEFFGRNFDVVALLLGGFPTLQHLIYIAIGAAAVFWVIDPCKCGPDCKSGTKEKAVTER